MDFIFRMKNQSVLTVVWFQAFIICTVTQCSAQLFSWPFSNPLFPQRHGAVPHATSVVIPPSVWRTPMSVSHFSSLFCKEDTLTLKLPLSLMLHCFLQTIIHTLFVLTLPRHSSPLAPYLNHGADVIDGPKTSVSYQNSLKLLSLRLRSHVCMISRSDQFSSLALMENCCQSQKSECELSAGFFKNIAA